MRDPRLEPIGRYKMGYRRGLRVTGVMHYSDNALSAYILGIKDGVVKGKELKMEALLLQCQIEPEYVSTHLAAKRLREFDLLED